MATNKTNGHDFRGLPPFLGALARHMGSAAGARRLAEKFGGQRKSIPRVARPGCVIAKACGIDVLRALVEFHGGESVYIPNRRTLKKELIADEIKKHLIAGTRKNCNQIAALVGCSERYVRDVRATHRHRAGGKDRAEGVAS